MTLEVILGAQYSMDGGATWQDSPEFTGLSASTAYRFVARYGATESRFASLASAELNVTTNAALSGGGYTYYTIKATAGVNGAISPSGSVSVREGRNQTFTITSNTGYAISNVKIDGKSVGAVKSYTFENVKGNHTIEAIFMKANGNPQTGSEHDDVGTTHCSSISSHIFLDAIEIHVKGKDSFLVASIRGCIDLTHIAGDASDTHHTTLLVELSGK